MIKINLRQIAKKIGKNISEMAKETGINRNTITSLYHNKVDGIKFSTLEKIIKQYDLTISDLLIKEESNKKDKNDIYRQEAEAVLFTGWPPLLATGNMNKNHFASSAPVACFASDIYAFFYWPKKKTRLVAKQTYEKFGTPAKADQLLKILKNNSRELFDIYMQIDFSMVNKMSDKDLLIFFKKISDAMMKMWSHGIFVDCFDEGFDQEIILKIVKKYNLTKQEVGILTTPCELTFIAQKDLAFLKIINKIIDKNYSLDQLKEFIENDNEVKKTIHAFDYYKSTYAIEKHIANQEVLQMFQKNLKNEAKLNLKIKELDNFSKDHQEKINKILQKNKLKDNPLQFFQNMTYWREYRKQLNLMEIHLLFAILDSLESKTGIARKYLEYLIFNEVELVLKGMISLETLKKRREIGILIETKEGDYRVFEAEEAVSLKAEYEKRSFGKQQDDIINGQVASQGYAKGIARVILNQNDFEKFQPGEILITGMTRPEFLPLMKQSTAIVTNEGGVTCHAAIVSRELGKPCIIGTKNATQIINDGDLIEVRANHGTVRILERR